MNLFELLGYADSDLDVGLARSLAENESAFFKALVQARIDSGKSQKDIADILGVDPGTVSRFEAGGRDPHFSTVQRYAMAVGVHLSYRVESLKSAIKVEDSGRMWEASIPWFVNTPTRPYLTNGEDKSIWETFKKARRPEYVHGGAYVQTAGC